MDFFKPTIDDYQKYKHLLQTEEFTCENLFLNMLIWQDIYRYEFALFDDKTLVIRLSEGDRYIYLLPFGESFSQALDKIISSLNNGDRLTASDGYRLEKLKAHLGDNFTLIPVEENFDYIYNVHELAELSGKKFHQKRNHISAFSRKYKWTYSSLSAENVKDFISVAKEWAKERMTNGIDPDIECELRSIRELLPRFELLDISGGIIYVNEKPVACTFGTPINDKVFDVTTEKALTAYQGAYAVINNSFVKNELLGHFEFVNREDDLGIEGLRRSKLSYNPVLILKKYIVEIKKP